MKRANDIRKSYTRHGIFLNDEIFIVGDQMQYEWEQDFIIMKWALERVSEFLDVATKQGYFTGSLHIAKNELLERITKYSCPSLKKKEYKTIENCPLKDKCKCLNTEK